MTKNVGMADRVIRMIIVLVILGLYLGGQITGTAAIILGIIAVIFFLTSLVGFCPAYVLFGISTKKTKKKAAKKAKKKTAKKKK